MQWEAEAVEEKKKILYADDDEDIRLQLKLQLEAEGYETIEASDGAQALELFDDTVDLVILDVMMPVMDGYKACVEIRKRSTVPILFLTAKSNESSMSMGFSVGGDYYLVKPWEYIDLVTRVKAGLRRYRVYGARYEDKQADAGGTMTCCGNIEIDPKLGKVRQDGREINFTKHEYQILYLLASNPGRVFSTQEIYEKVWNERYMTNSNNNVMVHIRNIRSKLGDDPKNSRTIRTVWGEGYKVE